MTAYAPTPTEDFARCPIYACLNKEWEPRGAEWTPNILLGRAIGDGMTQYYRQRKARENPRDPCDPTPEDVALKVLEAGYVEQETFTLDGLRKHVRAGLRTAIETSPVRGPILMVDEPLGSRARPDVVYRHPSAGLSIVDTKVKFKLDPRWRQKTLDEYETWWQGMHYAWEVGELLGEPVRYIGPHLITLTPKVNGEYHPIEVSPERLAFWLRQAETLWAQMDAQHQAVEEGASPIPNWFSCHGKYGRCVFYDWCHIVHGDQEKAEVLYQRKRRE